MPAETIQRRRACVLIAAAVLLACAFAPAAEATIRVELGGDGGLEITDREGNLNDVMTLGLRSSDSGGLEWEIDRDRNCGRGCFDLRVLYEVGSGCRILNVGPGIVRCTRLNGKATVNLLGGDDRFRIAAKSLQITDPITLGLGAGDDSGDGGSGDDTIQAGSGDDRVDGKAGEDVVQGSLGNDFMTGDLGRHHDRLRRRRLRSPRGSARTRWTRAPGTTRSSSGRSTATRRTMSTAGSASTKHSYVNRLTPCGSSRRTSRRWAARRTPRKRRAALDRVLRAAAARRHHHRRALLEREHLSRRGRQRPDLRLERGQHPDRRRGGGQLDGNAGNDIIDGKSGEGEQRWPTR